MYKMATSVGANLLLSVDIPQYSIIVEERAPAKMEGYAAD